MALDWRVLQRQQAEARKRLLRNFHDKEEKELMDRYTKEKKALLLAGGKGARA